jgi:3-deoxy-manno-octulosonate cytidylyltransferase (CMP-KDO synthetase)
MRIDAVLVDDVPFGVDTPEQLDEARRILAATQATTRDPP